MFACFEERITASDLPQGLDVVEVQLHGSGAIVEIELESLSELRSESVRIEDPLSFTRFRTGVAAMVWESETYLSFGETVKSMHRPTSLEVDLVESRVAIRILESDREYVHYRSSDLLLTSDVLSRNGFRVDRVSATALWALPRRACVADHWPIAPD